MRLVIAIKKGQELTFCAQDLDASGSERLNRDEKRESKASKVKIALEGIQQLRGPNFTFDTNSYRMDQNGHSESQIKGKNHNLSSHILGFTYKKPNFSFPSVL